jgi:hypothetical protein
MYSNVGSIDTYLLFLIPAGQPHGDLEELGSILDEKCLAQNFFDNCKLLYTFLAIFFTLFIFKK